LQATIANLKKGEKAIIKDFDVESIPLKLLEMGCLPGNTVQLLQIAPFGDPLYLDINGSHLAIRIETACQIQVEIIDTKVKQNKL
jgi:ferrous iron transport protein A